MPVTDQRRIVLHAQTRAKLQRSAKQCKDADTRIRFRIVLLADQGWKGRRIGKALGCASSTVSRTLQRFEQYGQAGLIDRREDNGQTKAHDYYIQVVEWILVSTPQAFFHRRPAWTLQLLIDTAKSYTHIKVSCTTMGRLLKKLKVRRGRPKPTATCPWSKRARTVRLAAIAALLEALPKDQAAVWEDEADIDLNPRIGLDYMLPGTQREVPTPGKNVKRYFAAAMDTQSDRVVWVKGSRKNSRLFIDLLETAQNLCREEDHPRGAGQLHDPFQQADQTVVTRRGPEIPPAFPAAVLSGRQPHRAKDLAGDARQCHGESPLRDNRTTDCRSGVLSNTPQ